MSILALILLWIIISGVFVLAAAILSSRISQRRGFPKNELPMDAHIDTDE